ncbi:MAG: tetratricopeptide repeat protein [Planctomycetota bacterium]|nr:tetratricopeptide repeat protein [Planctomycetota bacterium]
MSEKAAEDVGISPAAEDLEKKARAAEAAKEYEKAIRLFEQYVASFQESARYDEVKAHLDLLKKDEQVQRAIRTKQAAPDCHDWLMMADNFVRAGRPEKATEYLAKILANHADTDWGDLARERVRAICHHWLMMADDFSRAGMLGKATEYLERILANYPDTDWADMARERLSRLQNLPK